MVEQRGDFFPSFLFSEEGGCGWSDGRKAWCFDRICILFGKKRGKEEEKLKSANSEKEVLQEHFVVVGHGNLF